MLEILAKYVGAKVLTVLLVFGCACAGYWFYQHPDDLAAIWAVIKYALVWIAFVVIFPWAMFLVTRWVVARESNTAAGAMLGGYLLADVLAGLLLAGFSGHGVLTWMVLVAGFLAAGVYNFLVCEYLATRLENSA